MVTEDQREVIDFLSRPSTFGVGADEIDRLDTHSAIVFLAGSRAYKLKRAVRYDYLDFSTRELRHASCEAEVALNRRTAPQLYLGVLPVTRAAGGGLALGGTGDPIDWLVEMLRFDQSALLDRLASRRALDLELMPALADAIFHLHEIAKIRDDRGGSSGLSWVIEGNAGSFAECSETVFSRDACVDLNQRARTELQRHSQLLDGRRRQGFVRECHGDLHLRNIVLLDGTPTLFDAVEFNDQISCVDVLYDLAFLLMDLWRLPLRAHANRLFNAYLARAESLSALCLLPLFLSCRSAVRAKTSATAAGLQPDDRRRLELEATARDYLSGAAAFLRPPPPRLIAIGGLPGSGKSLLARGLAPGIGAAPGAVVLRSDVIRKSLFGLSDTARLGPDGYTRSVTDQVYRQLAERATVALRAGHAVILDAMFAKRDQRSAAEDVARSVQVPFAGVWLDAPADVLVHRVRARAEEGKPDASDAGVEVLQARLSDDIGPLDWTRVDASGDADTVQRRAESIL